jgi:HPt (histidine-containing phosphotransfer) domain-containing protein
MAALLHLETLRELYPSEFERRAFARRARALLVTDRMALQEALAGEAFETAREVVHRLQGSFSFLSASTGTAIDALCALSQALRRRRPEDARASTDQILRCLECLEDELAQVAQVPRANTRKHSATGATTALRGP